jgi:hypothetical protein
MYSMRKTRIISLFAPVLNVRFRFLVMSNDQLSLVKKSKEGKASNTVVLLARAYIPDMTLNAMS